MPLTMMWNEVTRIEVRGNVLAIKDAMIMLGADETESEGPSIPCVPGEYVMEINAPVPFFAHRARIRKAESDPILGKEIGNVSVDHAYVGFVDFEPFLCAVKDDFESYEEWTMTELDDELAVNFSGEILFKNEKLVYVKSGDGDGLYPVYELVEDSIPAGMECIFVSVNG